MSETYDFIDCEGLAGAWSLAIVGAPPIGTGRFKLVHRVSLTGGFGDVAMASNTHLVGTGWEQETGEPDETWTAKSGAYLAGTPPCSGFSLLNTSKKANARGASSAINSCMVELTKYAGRCRGQDGEPGPEFVSLESVQGAFTQGRPLMQHLRDIMETMTGQEYSLTHVKMSGASVGNAQMRHRYYMVLHRIPFGVDPPEPKHVVTYEDAIGDLVGLEIQWEDQPIPGRNPVGDFALRLRREGAVTDCHITTETNSENTWYRQIHATLHNGWRPGEDLATACFRNGVVPDFMKHKVDPETGKLRGWSWPARIRPNKPGYVLTGAGAMGFVHWSEDRPLTIRECARLMGYPDSWDWQFVKTPMQASMLIGKCCPVDSGRWIATKVAHALDDNPEAPCELIGEREYLHDSTLDYKRWPQEISGYSLH